MHCSLIVLKKFFLEFHTIDLSFKDDKFGGQFSKVQIKSPHSSAHKEDYVKFSQSNLIYRFTNKLEPTPHTTLLAITHHSG